MASSFCSATLSKQAAFFTPFITEGAEAYIQNVSAECRMFSVNGIDLPITISTKNESSYVSSVKRTYIDYALDELSLFPKGIQRAARAFIRPLGALLHYGGIDKSVIINNCLLSTILYPDTDFYAQAHTRLLSEYPSKALLFRGINEKSSPKAKKALQDLGYQLIYNRPVYLIDGTCQGPYKARMYKSDIKALNASDYTIRQDRLDPKRLSALYNQLNVEKYSSLNPILTPKFFAHALSCPLFEFYALEKNGRVDGVVGFYQVGSVIAAPIFGYDLTLPSSDNLYRILSVLLMNIAKERGVLLHASSGAGHFKKLRRAEKAQEYLAVYTRHLSIARRLPWTILASVMNQFAFRLMSRYDS